jgi:hypothetical protein
VQFDFVAPTVNLGVKCGGQFAVSFMSDYVDSSLIHSASMPCPLARVGRASGSRAASYTAVHNGLAPASIHIGSVNHLDLKVHVFSFLIDPVSDLGSRPIDPLEVIRRA